MCRSAGRVSVTLRTCFWLYFEILKNSNYRSTMAPKEDMYIYTALHTCAPHKMKKKYGRRWTKLYNTENFHFTVVFSGYYYGKHRLKIKSSTTTLCKRSTIFYSGAVNRGALTAPIVRVVAYETCRTFSYCTFWLRA